jgi:hypothetical protein
MTTEAFKAHGRPDCQWHATKTGKLKTSPGLQMRKPAANCDAKCRRWVELSARNAESLHNGSPRPSAYQPDNFRWATSTASSAIRSPAGRGLVFRFRTAPVSNGVLMRLGLLRDQPVIVVGHRVQRRECRIGRYVQA